MEWCAMKNYHRGACLFLSLLLLPLTAMASDALQQYRKKLTSTTPMTRPWAIDLVRFGERSV
ncbi:hypothetical protein [Shewanella benthica]|uniref:hypothetical protein n=1 Tax=Shewanella benthica TaxID=43661 RepID=UPI000DD2C4CD|nr:hypothetical protein [Shewanella benthica]